MNLHERPFGVRLALLAAALVVGVILGYGLGLVWIMADVAVGGHSDAHTGPWLVAVGIAYAITGLTALTVTLVAWRQLFR